MSRKRSERYVVRDDTEPDVSAIMDLNDDFVTFSEAEIGKLENSD